MSCSININKNLILHNIKALYEDNNRHKFGLFLKNNAYNLNINNISAISQHLDPMISFIACDNYDDLIKLRENNYKGECIYYGWDFNLEITLKYNFTTSVKSNDELKNICSINKAIPVVLMFDGGLNREGLDIDNLDKISIKILNSKVIVKSLWSQYIDRLKPLSTLNQNIINALNTIKNKYFPYATISLETSSTFDNSFKNRVGIPRVGQLIFGLWKYQGRINKIPLKCSLSLETDLYQIKKVLKGNKIGYSPRSTLKNNGYLGICSLGFDDFLKLPNDLNLVACSNQGKIRLLGPNFMSFGYVLFNQSFEFDNYPKKVIFQDTSLHNNIFSQLAKHLATSEFDIISRINHNTKKFEDIYESYGT